MRNRLAVLAAVIFLLPASLEAEEPVTPAATTPTSDARFDELIARQKQLEDQLRQQGELIRTLTKTVALPPAGAEPAPNGRFLAVPAVAASSDDPELTAPLAGYSDRNFFLRDRHSWFVVVPKGRINVDWYNFLNRPPPPAGVVPNSAADPRASLRDNLFLRRARLGLAGTIARHIDFRFEGEFATVPATGQYAVTTDASATINYWSWLKLEAGQMYAPFTLENQTSENFTDFMEKSTVVRFAVPNIREAGGMLFGEAPSNIVRYWVGVFDGDGQDYKNLDNQAAVIGRVVLAPLGFIPRHPEWLEEVWVGGSFWWQRADNLGGSAAPSISAATQGDIASLTTQSGFAIFNSNYNNGTDAMKDAIRSHLAPNGTILKYAFELNVPLWRRFGIRGEYVHQSIDLSEYEDVNPGNGNLARTMGPSGRLDGWGAYVEAYAWIGGDVNADRPGLYVNPHWSGYIPPKPPRWALLLAAKYEHVEMDITDLPSTINSGGSSIPDPANGHYALDTFELGGSFWVTRHSRVMANYVLNYVGAGDTSAPQETKNLFFKRFEHELVFRLQVNL